MENKVGCIHAPGAGGFIPTGGMVRGTHPTYWLELKEPATVLAPVTEGIPFLGLRIYPGVLRLNPRTLHRFRRQVRGRERAYRAGRLNLATLTQSVASLYAHVAHADTLSLRRKLVQRSLDLG